MLATIEKVGEGCHIKFERFMNHSVDEVWSWLTVNEKLSKWFSELRIEELKKGGKISFDMQDGTFEYMKIIEMVPCSVLEFNWGEGEDIVRFELYQEQSGCKLILNEKVQQITNHTPKDIAGWHVCLEVINALINGETISNRKIEWKKWYDKYVHLIEELPE